MRGLHSRIDCRDDRAHGLLIESFEAAAALQVFQVAADSALCCEFLRLCFINQSAVKQPLYPLRPHAPSFPLGERLFEKLKVTEWLHGIDTEGRQLVPAHRVIEPRLEMMHARIKKTFP